MSLSASDESPKYQNNYIFDMIGDQQGGNLYVDDSEQGYNRSPSQMLSQFASSKQSSVTNQPTNSRNIRHQSQPKSKWAQDQKFQNERETQQQQQQQYQSQQGTRSTSSRRHQKGRNNRQSNRNSPDRNYRNSRHHHHNHGHSHHHHSSAGGSGHHLRKLSEELDKANQFKVKNGCCPDCMKAFSKSGKACLCQVPRMQRRATLPQSGCKICGCNGCNPIDLRKDKRQQLKEKIMKDHKYFGKRTRLFDSDDEKVQLRAPIDQWFNAKKNCDLDFAEYFQILLNVDSALMGFGFPIRRPSYILGKSKTSQQQQPMINSNSANSIQKNRDGNSYNRHNNNNKNFDKRH